MAVNTNAVLPPLQGQLFVDTTGRLTPIGLQTLQSMFNALQVAQTALTAAQTTIAALKAELAVIPNLPTPASPSYATDAAAKVGGVAVGAYYRNGSVIQMRVT